MKKNFILSTLLTLASSALVCDAQTFNPTDPALGFNVFARNDVRFQSGHSDGPIAMGGNLNLAGAHNLCMHNVGTYPNGQNAAGNFGLVIGGRIFYNSNQNTQILSNKLLRLGNTTGTTLLDKDNNNASLHLRAISSSTTFQTSQNYITQTTGQRIDSALSSSRINFTAAGNLFENYTNIINNYNITQTNSATFNFATVPTATGGTQTINIQAGKVNYINLSAAQLTAMATSNASYVFNPSLSATTIVVFNIQATGSYTWTQPAMASINGTDGQYILWNFASLTSLEIVGGRNTYGTIYAPKSTVTKTEGNNTEGQIIANNANLNSSGEIHYQVFAGQLPNGSPLPPVGGGGPNPGSSIPLPIQKMQLAIQTNSSNAVLNYEVIASAPIQQLSLEVSKNASQFELLSNLSIADQKGQLKGIYSDYSANNGTIYYRLKATDEFGEVRYSNTVIFKAQSATTVEVYPNPFTNAISISNNTTSDVLHYSIMNMTGSTVKTGTISGGNSINDLNNLPTGMYLLQLNNDNVISTFKLMKN